MNATRAYVPGGNREAIPDNATNSVFTIVAAVYRRAIRDALGNDPIERVDAVHFLDIAAPDWREQLHERGGCHNDFEHTGEKST